MRFVILSAVLWRAAARFPSVRFSEGDPSHTGVHPEFCRVYGLSRPTHESANIALGQQRLVPSGGDVCLDSPSEECPGQRGHSYHSARFSHLFLRNVHVQILNFVMIHWGFTRAGMSKRKIVTKLFEASRTAHLYSTEIQPLRERGMILSGHSLGVATSRNHARL